MQEILLHQVRKSLRGRARGRREVIHNFWGNQKSYPRNSKKIPLSFVNGLQVVYVRLGVWVKRAKIWARAWVAAPWRGKRRIA